MRRVIALLASLGLLISLLPSVAVAAPRDASSLIVVFRDDVANPRAAAADLAAEHGLRLTFVYEHALKGFAAEVPAGRAAALARDARVAYVEADQIARTSAQIVPTGVRRIFADADQTIDGADDLRVNVDVAIIDTGIDLDHPDLDVVASIDCTGGNPLRASCGSGGDDDNGHGTHVAGTVAAIDDGVGVVGVAPGARLHAVKVLRSDGSGYISGIVAGIDWVTARASTIEVANMSLGCECASAAMDSALAKSVDNGVAYAVAAGNNDGDASTFSPANHPDVLTVSALADFNGLSGGGAAPTCRSDVDDTLADFSNWGSKIEIAAPGVCILSTVPGGGWDDRYSGTSMASPHAAGALALLASSRPTGSQADVTELYGIVTTTGNLTWTDDSGDGIQEPLLDVTDGRFAPATVAGSGGGNGGDGGDTGGDGTTFGLTPSGSATSQGRSWTANVTISAVDPNGNALSGVEVTGAWNIGGGTTACTTVDGTCTVSRSAISKSTGSATFTVSGATYSGGLTWDGGPDSVTVIKP